MAVLTIVAIVAALAVTRPLGSGGRADVKLEATGICLGWRPHLVDGTPALAGARCDRRAAFRVGARTVSGFRGGVVPVDAETAVAGWTPLRVEGPDAGRRVISLSNWPALGVASSDSAQSCLTLHRQTGGPGSGALTADILACERDARDQQFVIRSRRGGVQVVSLQPLENGAVCLTRPSGIGAPATFSVCRDAADQIFSLSPSAP